jgi:hypothetical protein
LQGNAQYLQVAFCINNECFKKGRARYKSEEIKPFHGVVWIPSEGFDDQLPILDGVVWKAYPFKNMT